MNAVLLILIFLASVITILVLSKKSLWVSIFLGALLISLTCNDPLKCIVISFETATNIEMLLLALALAELPIMGRILEIDLQKAFENVGSRASSILGPATLGLLPIPGGAVLSCPIVEKSLEGVKSDYEKVAINIWFRHILFLVYPLSSALIVAATVAKLNLLHIIPYMVLPFLAALGIGYFYFLREEVVSNNKNLEKKSMSAIFIIICAPILQALLSFFGIGINEATFVAVTFVLVMSIIYYHIRPHDIRKIALKMKVWNFSLILLAVIFYAKMFSLSQMLQIISSVRVHVLVIYMVIPFTLGLLTGRVKLAVSLVLPIILYGYGPISVGIFIIIYCSSLAGYLMSPAHPCLVLSSEYFHSDMKKSIKSLLVPTLVFVLFSTVYGLFLDVLIG